MKIAIICAVILSAATAGAETTIIVYPDHFKVESTGVLRVALLASANRSSAQPTAAGPVSNFDNTPQPADPAGQRAAINNLIQRLQSEQSELMTPQAGETPDQRALRQQEALGKLNRINRLRSELLAIPVQSIELSK